jgi:glutathione synthase/RimK-type ligase-like ATP-grasp enzyme
MVLILTDRNDSHASHLLNKPEASQLPIYKLCLDVQSLKATSITFDGSWRINQNGNHVSSGDIKCVWNRRTFVELLLDEEYDQTNDFKIWKNEWNKTLTGFYNSIRHVPWLNPWRNAYKAENKYLQMEVAEKIGFKLPKTIVSNQKVELLRFSKENNPVVLKLMNQDFYKTDDGQYLGFYVNKISHDALQKFKDNSENPIVLQEYLEKDFEVRYTVVGSEHFVCKIESQKSSRANVDWRRYDIPNTPHYAILPPNEIREKINHFMKELDIEYGAIDFIVTKTNEWYFLEVNSLGQYLWIEDLTGLKISDEIINWFKKNLNLYN